ncbi:MAG: thioesterase family protein [Alphaproteobacteria bacterium]|nr:thioesterase family protein [Alphaproteobacteria bacterium]
MKDSLAVGLTHSHTFTVSDSKAVPEIFPESEIIRSMPRVFATGFMVGLMEWACVDAIATHLEAGEGSLGIHVDVSHSAATPIGMAVTVDAELVAREGQKLTFEVVARDELEEIGRGRHQRYVVHWDRFDERLARKVASWRDATGR